MPAVPQVHLVRPEEVPACVASLVRAFYDDPMLEYMFPDPRTRGGALRRFFTLQLRQMTRRTGLAYTTEECRSTAMWIPPRTGPPGARDVIAQLPMLLILGRRAGAALQLVQLVESRHPKTPHYYLGGLGTDPQWQGRGLGSAVLSPVLEICDREGLPAYLESSKESNVPFYSRHGFEVTGEVSVPDGSVRLWLMWREPSRASSELHDA
jgi:GNAT superfamily N-acetyltransferase